jgi:hypothetical protein
MEGLMKTLVLEAALSAMGNQLEATDMLRGALIGKRLSPARRRELTLTTI